MKLSHEIALCLVGGLALLAGSSSGEEAKTNSDGVSNTMIVAEFKAETPGWEAVNDGVMGGLSAGAGVIRDGVMHFSGNLSLENNGGFSSVRTEEGSWDLSGKTHLRLRVKGDGRTYILRLYTDARHRGSRIAYGAEFPTKDGKWSEVDIPVFRFKPSHHGDLLEGPDLDLSSIRQVGLQLSDGKAGAFALEVEWIKAH